MSQFTKSKKNATTSVLSLKIKNTDRILSDFALDWDEFFNKAGSVDGLTVEITAADLEQSSEYLPIVTYIAGYCCHVINKKLKCDPCKQRIICAVGDVDKIENTLIAAKTRGGLLYPCLEVVHISMLSYMIVNKLAPQKVFLNCFNQRKLVVESTTNALESENFLFMHQPNCPNGHSVEKLIKMWHGFAPTLC